MFYNYCLKKVKYCTCVTTQHIEETRSFNNIAEIIVRAL